MLRHFALAAVLLPLAATPASALGKWEGPAVRVAFVASDLSDEAQMERTVAVDQPFMVQRLTATGSVTLQSNVEIKFWHRTTRFAQGRQLFQATGANGFVVYCGDYDPGAFARSGGSFKHQWACLEDTNADGVFDKAYWAPDNPGAFLPIFGEVFAGPEVSVAYKVDAAADRFYFESAIVLTKRADRQIFFNWKLRRPGDQDWSHGLGIRVVRNRVTMEGVLVGVPANGLPATVTLADSSFKVLSSSAAGVTLKPEAVRVGERVMPVYERP